MPCIPPSLLSRAFLCRCRYEKHPHCPSAPLYLHEGDWGDGEGKLGEGLSNSQKNDCREATACYKTNSDGQWVKQQKKKGKGETSRVACMCGTKDCLNCVDQKRNYQCDRKSEFNSNGELQVEKVGCKRLPDETTKKCTENCDFCAPPKRMAGRLVMKNRR